MAISEAKALMEMVKNAATIVKGITKGYYEASVEMKAFPDEVKRLKEIAKEWEERLRKFPLPADSPVRPRLENAVALLREEVERMEQNNRSCCLMFCKKVAFPELLTLNMNMVIQAFDDIPKSLQDKRECDQLVEDEANRVLAPFSFSSDDKYVPINETVEELRRALEDDTSRHNVVVLYGESGQGKTTMAKYLALEYQQKSTQKIQSSSSPISTSSGCFNKIYFIGCGKNADSTILMQKLWKELGYRAMDESGATPLILDRFEQGEGAQLFNQRRKPEIEDTRRKIMARLENRERMLIVLEDVWEQNVIEDLYIKHTCIKYLITTQKSDIWLDAERVQMAKPTAEEAARVLANHVTGWGYGESFPQEVQEEVGRLVEGVDRKPFILANLATSIRSKKEAMDPKTWRTLRRGLVETLKEVDEMKRRPTAFGESYKPDVVAAMTMAVESFTERTQTLLFFVVIFTEDEREVEEIVLQVLFRAFYGSLMNFRSSFYHLKDSSFITINSTAVAWREEPFTRWSTHDLRRQFVGGMKQAEAIIQKLVSMEEVIHPDDDEQQLYAALCYLYGNQSCRSQAKRKLVRCKFDVCPQLERDECDKSWINPNAITFVRGWVLLLSPEHDEEWEKQKHEAARKVLLHLLKFGQLHDGEVANLLRNPRTRLHAFYVLGSYTSFAPSRTSIGATTVEALLEEVMHLGRKSISPSVLGVLTHAMESIFGIGADAEAPQHVYPNTGVMVEILRVYVRLCADGSSPECQRQAGQALEVFISSKEICKILVDCAGAIDILVGLIHHETPLSIVQNLTHAFFRILSHGIDDEDDVNFDFINRVLENYIAIFTETINPALKIESTRALGSLCWNRIDILELLMKHLVAGEINTLVLLKLIDKHSRPLTVRSVGRFFYRILVTSEAVDVKLQVDVRANVIADVLKCFIGILVDGTQSQSRIQAVWILRFLAESEEIQKLIVVDSRVIEQVGGLLQEDVSSSDLRTLTYAIYNIYVLGAQVDLNDKVKLRVFTHILKTYVGFLADEGMKLDMQIEAVRGLELFGSRDEIRKHLVADLRLQDSLSRLLRVKLDVSPILLQHMANFLFHFFVKERKIEGKNSKDMISPVIQKALESFSRILMEDFKPEVQNEAIRGLGMLAARPDIRELIVGYKGALKRSVELLRGTATTRILRNVHEAIEFISAKGPDPEDLDENTAEFRSWALKGYISLLRDDVPAELQEAASQMLLEILMFKDNRKVFALGCPSGDKNLKFLLDLEDQKSSHWPFNCGYYASAALTLIDPLEGIDLRHSPEGYLGRGHGHMLLGMFENALVDFNKALEIRPDFGEALRRRAAARLQLDNTIGALEDLDHVLMMQKNRFSEFCLQERGIVKRLMGDFSGALADLNKSLAVKPNDYEVLKHRGYVRFLMGDESAARADAERAIVVSTVETFRPYYILERKSVLGTWPVKFLEFELRCEHPNALNDIQIPPDTVKFINAEIFNSCINLFAVMNVPGHHFIVLLSNTSLSSPPC